MTTKALVMEFQKVVGKDNVMSDEADTETIVTYHDSCHLKKSLGVISEHRQVIQAAKATVSSKCWNRMPAVEWAAVSTSSTTAYLRGSAD